MVRKSSNRTPASSAAAAAANTAAPRFTSFAAATAHALGAYPASGASSASTPVSSSHAPSQWDTDALQLLKKLSKRDANTKLRALSDLSTHVDSLSELAPGVGSEFVNAWGPAFRSSVLDDPSPAVRTALLTLMATLVSKFRRLIQPIFPSVLPVWIAAQGDLTPSVADVAVVTIRESLPTPAHRAKVVDRYGDDLRAYCTDVLKTLSTGIDPERFLPEARHATAVLTWLVDAACSPAAVVPVIDMDPNPLMLLARGPKRKKKDPHALQSPGGLREACQLAVSLLAHMSRDDETDNIRATQFAELALHGVRKCEPLAWDLLLVLLRDGWHQAFANDFNKLGGYVADAVSATPPTGLSALLPFFDALPRDMVTSAEVAERILSRMKNALLPNGETDSEIRQQVNVSYVLFALPTYIECASFAHIKGSSRWFGAQGAVFHNQYSRSIFAIHLLPTLQLFLTDQLPPLPKLQYNASSAKSRRRPTGNAINSVAQDVSLALARSMEGMTKESLLTAFEAVSESFVNSLSDRDPDIAVERYLLILNNMSEDSFPSILATAVVRELISLSTEQFVDVHLLALSSTLSNGASCSILKHYEATTGQSSQEFVSKLLRFNERILNDLHVQMGDKNVDCKVKQIGEVYSWIYWVTGEDDKTSIWNTIMDAIERSSGGNTWMYVTGETVQAHKKRRELTSFSSWSAIGGERLERAVIIAAKDMGMDKSSCALSFVTSVADPQGGASIPVSVLRLVAEVIAEEISVHSELERYDGLLKALLRSPVQYLQPEDAFRRMLAVGILRAAENDAVFSEIVSLLRRLPASEVVEHISRILNVISGHKPHPLDDKEKAACSRAKVTARLMSDISAHIGRKCIGLCEKIMSWSSPVYIIELLRLIPMSSVFGGGDSGELLQHQFLDIYEEVGALIESGEVSARMNAFVETLSSTEIGDLARLATERILNGANRSMCKLLSVMCAKISSEQSEWSLVSDGIAKSMFNAFPRIGEGSVETFGRVPEVMHLCVTESHGVFLPSFQKLLEQTVKIIRRDPFSANSTIALDILSASLTPRSELISAGTLETQKKLQWFVEETALALLAVRRSLERSLSASRADREMLETHGAVLFTNTIQGLGVGVLAGDDVRFWALRTNEILRSYIEVENVGEMTSVSTKRLAGLAMLASALVDLDESATVVRSDIVLELCHNGAWSGVSLLPVAEEVLSNDLDADTRLVETGANGTCALILKAAEKGVLLNPDGSIPVDIDRVYCFAPLLSSRTSSTRKAILTLLAYSAAVDLPDRVSNAFPKDGFADEAKEVQFVTDLIPRQLRVALEWPKVLNTMENKEGNEYARRELGYFLAWRLFLDFIRADDANVGGSAVRGDTQEDVSFRRVGITFLRSQPELYSEFFNKCVEVVVDGSVTERVAAGAAAAEALHVEERAAQGIQLVEQQEAQETRMETVEVEERQVIFGSEMDEEVGKAAGIAFARTLQRLPALSRQYVTDRLDYGTALRVEAFVRRKISPLLIAAEIRKVKEWGAFGGSSSSSSRAGPSSGAAEVGTQGGGDGEGELHARGSVAGREVWATYTFSDVTLEIGMCLPDVFPLHTVEVEARSRIGMSEARWRKTLLGMTTLLRAKDGTLAEAVELWRRNLDKTFQGAEECPICYSVLHLTNASLPRMQCRTCKNLFHSECLCKWFTKSNSSACPLCRSAF